jgi:sulfite reductase beta subunit
MVHETSDFHSMTKMDWEAKDGARGIQFSNPPQLTGGYPIYATSDLPATWPTSGWPAPETVTEVWAGTDTWNKWERVGEWVERIGWEKFFEICDLPFTYQHIDDYKFQAYDTYRTSMHFKF